MRICLRCEKSLTEATWTCSACGYEPKKDGPFAVFAPEFSQQNEGYDASFYAELFEVESKNFWFRARNELIVWCLKRYFPAAKSLLEVGCGTGFVLSRLEKSFADLKVWGTEIYAEGLGFAKRRLTGGELFQADARALPFQDEFDVIGAFDVLEHIDEDVVVLKRFHRAVRAGGGVIITVPQHPFLWSEFDAFSKHVRRYRRQELVSKLQVAGFEVVCVGSFVSLLFPAIALTRFAKKTERQMSPEHLKEHMLADLKMGRLMNWTLEKILAVERLLIKAGLRFPFGGSLFAVAIKKAV